MGDLPTLIIIVVAVLAALLVRARWFRRAAAFPLPPSPPGYPIIGNLLDVPKRDMEPAFRDLTAKYGTYFSEAMYITDVVFGLRTGWTWLFSVNGYGPQWRKTRRLFHEYMHPNAVLRYRPIQEREACKYLLRVVEDPKNFLHHGRHLFGAITIRVGYGIDVDEHKDTDYLGIAETAMATFSLAFLPGKYLVEPFPILRFLPSFMPGAGFKREAAEWYPIVRKMRDLPWEAAMSALREGSPVPSMASGLLERMSHLDEEAAVEQEEWSKNAIASAYAGGADTTLSTLQTFYIAMASFPQFQKRAQAELDTVVGPHRLPTFADKDNLPYVTAVIKECFRWRPVVPLALVHYSIEEDEYGGYRIPARSAVVCNPWAYVRDPRIYQDPEAFNPERFLKDGRLDHNVQDPATIVFGYGRRICPGRYFAEGSVYAAVSRILHTMSIEAPLDEHGQPICLADRVKMTHGVISYPEPFDCVIKPRSPEAEMLIRTSCSEDDPTAA
ncbi:cytochrome P450 [Dichomitus squalens LYAD-421 SS1]|uniref:Cytochrome P450 n=1 Tax=Dichomitus squalens (strain LYAD-421) TaxID=732165 RepID=R7SIH2_DICSQ|nr:cytochrome P450 [Dichomitus squalens LYAD-421 SS1]EJF55961.1 cytochrome P450 [Dichomitus squalens LYAD-421 SS1]